uniref:Putative pancreatic lipase-like enzyme n=1 Tax=Ixodes scapularis TaxID=6945 RepID=A0A4D5RR99_IXOSC
MQLALSPLLLVLSAGTVFRACANVAPEDAEHEDVELSDVEIEDINAALKRFHYTRLLSNAAIEAELVFPKVNGSFPMSGNVSHLRPQAPDRVNPRFLVHTNRNGDGESPTPLLEVGYDGDMDAIAELLDVKEKLYILVHGFRSKARARWMQRIKNEILAVENATVILVDWSQGSGGKNYSVAAGNTRLVARVVAMLLERLVRAGVLQLENVHYIGHSLGAQTAGFLGEDLQDMMASKIGRITGLDPAGPMFQSFGVHLRPEHAHFVDVIHTSMGMGFNVFRGRMGITIDCGHVDFYPNGGRRQPGCKALGKFDCSHGRAALYYANSIRTCSYPSVPCSDYKTFKGGWCSSCGTSCGFMGHNASPLLRGRQFLRISAVSPHCASDNSGPASAVIVWTYVMMSVVCSLSYAVCSP